LPKTVSITFVNIMGIRSFTVGYAKSLNKTISACETILQWRYH